MDDADPEISGRAILAIVVAVIVIVVAITVLAEPQAREILDTYSRTV